jgi:hypothetical protein
MPAGPIGRGKDCSSPRLVVIARGIHPTTDFKELLRPVALES